MPEWEPLRNEDTRQISRRQLLQIGAFIGLGLGSSVGSRGSEWTRLAAAGQAEQTPRAGGILTMWIAADPPNFDVHQNSTYVTQHVTAPCYNNLVQYDPLDPDRVIPDLAERWDVSPDGQRYTFQLRPDVRSIGSMHIR